MLRLLHACQRDPQHPQGAAKRLSVSPGEIFIISPRHVEATTIPQVIANGANVSTSVDRPMRYLRVRSVDRPMRYLRVRSRPRNPLVWKDGGKLYGRMRRSIELTGRSREVAVVVSRRIVELRREQRVGTAVEGPEEGPEEASEEGSVGNKDMSGSRMGWPRLSQPMRRPRSRTTTSWRGRTGVI